MLEIPKYHVGISTRMAVGTEAILVPALKIQLGFLMLFHRERKKKAVRGKGPDKMVVLRCPCSVNGDRAARRHKPTLKICNL
jgi:hypothetical protein